jgi:hypothetical protein
VLECTLSFKSYREDRHPLLDEDVFRKERRIVRVSGTIRDDGGTVIEEFEAGFNGQGCLVCDAVRFADGSLIGDWGRVTGLEWLNQEFKAAAGSLSSNKVITALGRAQGPTVTQANTGPEVLANIAPAPGLSNQMTQAI